MSEPPSKAPASNASPDFILVGKIALLLACIFVFIVGINSMSAAIKGFGEETGRKILETTASPFVGLFIGILATALIQSSSTTTSIIVGAVAAGTVTIEGAIPMVMGANIGTTVTCLIVSLGQIAQKKEFKRAFAAATVHDFFNLISVAILFPIEIATGFLAKTAGFLQNQFSGVGADKLGNPLKKAVKPIVEGMSDILGPAFLLIVSIAIIIGMLVSIVRILRSLVLERVESFFDKHLFRNAWRAMAFGMLLTCAVQSSSITTSLAIPLAGAGVLTLAQIFPYALGANVGTTLTAMIAAMATTENTEAAVTVAFAHLMFNVSGILIIWPHPKVRAIPIKCAEWLSEEAEKRIWVPVAFLLTVFFGVPLLMIGVFR